MAIQEGQQYLRKAALTVYNPEVIGNNPSAYVPGSAIDLSGFHFRFQTAQEDEESPNNCSIRVYNLSTETVRKVKEEYSRVVLQAGYQNGPYGIIFDGTVKQFRTGKEINNNTTTYLDILAADGDIAYNWAMLRKSLAAGSTVQQRAQAIVEAMRERGGLQAGQLNFPPDTGGVLPRGKVLFGYAKAAMRELAETTLSTWSIQNGKVNVVALDSYLPGAATVLTAHTGLIGRPEQTQEGIKARSLLNPAIQVGGRVLIDNASINQTQAAPGAAIPGAQLAYNQYSGFQQFANVAADGLYRVYVAEHEGDTRGMAWYTNLVCLTVNPTNDKVQPYGY